MSSARWQIAVLLAAACTPVSGPGPENDPDLVTAADVQRPFDLRVGQGAFVARANTVVRFLDVTEDSRCPSHALILCVWEGNGSVLVEVAEVNGGTLLDTLHTRLEPKSIDLGPVVLHLDALAPYPETTTPIPVEDYVARFMLRVPD